MTFKFITIIVMSFFYALIGLKHIFDPKYFLPMMPPFIPFKKFMIYITGLLEIVFGVGLLIEETRFYAGVGIVILLLLVFPANIYIAINDEARKKLKVTKLFAVLRLFLQLPLIYLAYWHTL